MLGRCGSPTQTSELLDPGHASSPEHARRFCSPVPTSFSRFVFIFLIFISHVQPSQHLSSFSASGAHPRPRWSVCSVNICFMNGWLMFIYSVYMEWMVWLYPLFGEGSRPHLDLIICHLWPRKPLDEQRLPSCPGLDFSYLPHDMFHLCHFQSRLIFFSIKESLEDPLSGSSIMFLFVCF